MSAARFLVVGGSGFLGRHVVAWACAQGFDVGATYLSTPLPHISAIAVAHDIDVEWIECDITDSEAVAETFTSFRPTVVVNTAYRQHGPGATEVCSLGAANVADACAKSGARMVHVSTDLVFDGMLDRPYVEDDALNPLNDYGRAKAAAETLVSAACPNSVLVRTSLIYGDPDGHQEKLVLRAVRGEEVAFFFDEWRNPAPVDGLADALGRLGLDDRTGLLHITGNERIDRLSFARALARSMDLDPSLLRGAASDLRSGPRPSELSLDTSLAESLGYGLRGPSAILNTN